MEKNCVKLLEYENWNMKIGINQVINYKINWNRMKIELKVIIWMESN